MTDKQMSETVENIIRSLTLPLSEREKKTGSYRPLKPTRIAATGALEEIQNSFYEKGWTDGLPINPPTEEKVAQMLKGTTHAPHEIVTTSMWPENSYFRFKEGLKCPEKQIVS